MFGPNQPVILHLIEIEPGSERWPRCDGTGRLRFPLLKGPWRRPVWMRLSGVNWALLVGSVPRKRAWSAKICSVSTQDLYRQGQALQKMLQDVRVLVIGNPCIQLLYRMIMPPNSARPFLRDDALDENRAKLQLAKSRAESPR